MKILHVIETLGRGGAERLLVMLLPELARHGHDVAVAVCRGPYDLQPELEAAGVQVLRLPHRAKWNLLAGASDIAKAMPGAAIIHAHLYFPAVMTALARRLGLTRARTVVTFHNLAYAGANRDGWKLRLRKALARTLYRRGISRKLAVSQAVADHYVLALRIEGIEVLHNPIDLESIRSVECPTSSDDPRLHIVLPGRLAPEKGHRDLLDAMADPRLARRPFRLTFAGHGKLQANLEARAEKLNIPLSVTGNLDHPRFLQVLATADIVVVPSRYEGFGLTALEAMALSKPVIATTAGGLPEVLGKTGLLVPVGDAAALAGALADLMDSPSSRMDLGAAGGARASAEFGLSETATRLIDLYRQTPDH